MAGSARVPITVAALVALVFAVVGWTRDPAAAKSPVRAVRIVDVRPLHTSDRALSDMFSHELAVRVSLSGWRLYPYRPGATSRDNRREGGHWRIYVDGQPLAHVYTRTTYTPYLAPGTHWLVAELRNVDQSSLRPSVWSEPVVLYVPGR